MTDPTLDDARLMFAFAHDMRGYLRTMLTRIQIVQTEAALPLAHQDAVLLAEASSAAADMNALLSAMVSYCGVTSEPARTMGLRLMLRGVLIGMKATLTGASAEVSVDNELDVTVPLALQVVLKELLANACRFRREDTPLLIKLRTRMTEQETFEITVSDNGTGIDPAGTDKIFLPFQRMHPRSDYSGFGLGLALCRRIALAYGGSIGANVPTAGGLAVVVTIPAV